LTEAAAAEEAVKNGDQIANSTRRCAPTRQNRPLFEVSNSAMQRKSRRDERRDREA
jgi:hypothetical protein